MATLHSEVREQFWGDLAQQSWQDWLSRFSIEARDRYRGVREYERSSDRTDARNGFYDRAFVTRLLLALPELLAFFQCPWALWLKLRTTNVSERCFVEVRRRTRPMMYFVNVQSVEQIVFSIFNRFNLEWRLRTLRQFTQVA